MDNKIVCLAAMGCSVAFYSSASAATKSKQNRDKPNVIYILMDDLGYGDVGCYGQQKIETPNIDCLARDGVRFTQSYSGSPVSAPSRCVLMTGLHTGHSYIRGNDEMGSRGDVWSFDAMYENPYLEGQAPMPDSTYTIAKMMKNAGYTTGIVGKWGLGYPGSVSAPNKMGFDYFFGYNCQRQAHVYYPMFLYENENRVYLDNAPLLKPTDKLDVGADPLNIKSYDKFKRKVYSNDIMQERLMGFVDKNADKPFFLMWTTPIPHASMQAPDSLVQYYVDKFGDEKPYLGGYLPTRYAHATYAAMVTYFDTQIGELIESLKAKGIYDNTIIVFTSDNGPTFNGGADSPWFNSGGIFKSEEGWGKCSLQEGGVRVPMIVAWKAKIKPGRTSNLITAFWDVMPTLCELTGSTTPKTDGISFLPELLGKKQIQEHQFLYWEYPELSGSKAVRMGKWKGIIKDIKKGNNEMLLFNLEEDIQEQNNVAAKYPEVVKSIRDIMAREHTEPANKRFVL